MKELIKRLRMQAKLTKHYCPTAKIPTLEENAANAIEKLEAENERLKNGVTVQEWISVNDRLPETIIDVLVFSENGDESKLFIAYYSNKKWWDSTSNIRIVSVTNWMPMPEPPKGE